MKTGGNPAEVAWWLFIGAPYVIRLIIIKMWADIKECVILMGFRSGQDSKESIEMLTQQVSGEQAVVFTHVVAASFHWRK